MTTPAGQTKLDVIPRLMTAADTDTLYRDVHLLRARTLLAPRCSLARYEAVRDNADEVGRLLQQARSAVARQDWEYVGELGERAETLQKTIEADAELLELARAVYEAPPVVLDPFSPGLGKMVGAARDPGQVRAELLTALDALVGADAEHAEFYRARRSAIAALAVAGEAQTGEQPAGGGSADAEKRAMLALEAGNVDALRRVAADVLRRASPAATSAGGAPGSYGITTAPSLGEAFPAACVERAGSLGLEPATAELGSPAAAVAEFMERNAWRASPATMAAARDGIVQLREAMKTIDLPPALAEAATETVSLFALQLYVNSAGLRFVPLPAPKEHVLVEGFTEGDDAPSALLQALGLPARRGLARTTIEARLLERGAAALQEHLGLEPAGYRLVCIPPDLYVRLGAARGWGQRPEWTHFDGYQVMRGGVLRALVGGNARYGGLADLCSISAADGRENVTTRLAVVRRDRLAVRLR